ncbi:MAG: ribosomal RNA small subunit methyltransferase A [Candidatus Sumerlaeia bacterium]|nr:ribosomal RNA small subunit methyltransferase A [Candidatus Sumerlaeia bacterium]
MSEEFEFPSIGELLNRVGFRPSKHKDQHFLRSRGHARQIAEFCLLTPQHRVLEIGAGLGNLSFELARRAGAVVAVEKDTALADWHRTLVTHAPNLRVHYADFLKVNLDEAIPHEPADGPLVAVGNLPYQITAPILFRLVDSTLPWERIVVMVQLEVAERIATGPATRRSSALTYKLAFEYDARIVMRLGPSEFVPPPKVQSAVVVLAPKATPLVRDRAHKERLHALVHGIFQHRRRTLANAMTLAQLVGTREQAERAIGAAGLDPQQRPETLGLDDCVRLDDALAEGRGR